MPQSSGSTGRGDVTWPDAVHPPDVQGRDLDSWVALAAVAVPSLALGARIAFTVTRGSAGSQAAAANAGRITGPVKLGDTVSAQLAKAAGGKYVVSEIQDPPGLP